MNWRPLVVAGGLLWVLTVSVWGVWSNERIVADGAVLRLELAPVDPRSLMQGDYMALRFAIDRGLTALGDESEARDGPPATYAVLALDAEGRARLAGVADALPAGDTVAMRIRWRDGGPTVGPNAFFFQEGTAETYEAARWGEFRVAPDGSALLTHLRDEALTRLGEQRR